ncbi:aminodeoxychorismate synthase component I [Brachybacterium saurashtrense]|uniref:Aminodeoxychorismate synthase component I n=1 Tax=Brachybacterium saurashtrense TaxID=556288 RepID=A0A345YRL1_9MICO|nr:aminodeoxychorismate synthase component I [Brachybacterium saurashtrense]AXK46563.1 aminodeoxychorismate synthase component I [Brachybacterium saurashtrense]RRR24304.1 aminodeoxychorismate synthase component I [Brachybacterium saurashtrense]
MTSSSLAVPRARLDDLVTGEVLQFERFTREIRAERPEEVRPALAEIEQAVAAGSWAVVMLAYEAAAGLDPQAQTHPGDGSVPLAWAGIAEGPDPHPAPLTPAGGYALEPWLPDWARAEHADRIAAVRAAIAEGNTYQTNLTTRLRSQLTGDPYGLYGDLARRQRGAHHAYLDLGDAVIVSASPETFLTWDGEEVTTAPMKGTAVRTGDPARDRAAREALVGGEKDRAENVMIVDLLRNDLARISEPGSVQVTELLGVEEYPTVLQLVSRLRARTRPGTGLVDVLAAMFPCGSITGAPKLSTMELITRLEDSPRGVYCGAIGVVAPGDRPRARFSVAIRTVVLDRADGTAVYGAGGGITWGSTADGEYDELLAKAAVLPVGEREPFALLETIAVHEGHARHLEHHLRRLRASAAHFRIVVDEESLTAALADLASLDGAQLVRLRLRRDGSCAAEPRPLTAAPEPVLLAVDDQLTDIPTELSAHKTTVRDHFDAARARHPQADDVILRGVHGRLVETTIASLALRLDGTWCTPPLADGCLDGVGRRLAREDGTLVERELTVADLHRAEEIALLSSARGWRRAVLAAD